MCTIFKNKWPFVAEDDVQKVVSVAVDGKEAQMVFIDHAYSDMAVSKRALQPRNFPGFLSRNPIRSCFELHRWYPMMLVKLPQINPLSTYVCGL